LENSAKAVPHKQPEKAHESQEKKEIAGADGEVVGPIYKANAALVGSPWMWTLAFGHHEDRPPTHGYAATRQAAMAAFAKSWRRE
jgi:hypothetical protein